MVSMIDIETDLLVCYDRAESRGGCIVVITFNKKAFRNEFIECLYVELLLADK